MGQINAEAKALADRLPGMPDQEESLKLMEIVMGHYVAHSKIVLIKINHAKTATKQSLAEGNHDQRAKKYEALWDNLIEQFRLSGISEEGLWKVERILSRLPKSIDKFYQALCEEDGILQELMRELNTEEYMKAYAVIKGIQNKPDPMSGLMPEEYEIKQARAYLLKPASTKPHVLDNPNRL